MGRVEASSQGLIKLRPISSSLLDAQSLSGALMVFRCEAKQGNSNIFSILTA